MIRLPSDRYSGRPPLQQVRFRLIEPALHLIQERCSGATGTSRAQSDLYVAAALQGSH
jgi:hypothetical protein